MTLSVSTTLLDWAVQMAIALQFFINRRTHSSCFVSVSRISCSVNGGPAGDKKIASRSGRRQSDVVS